MLAGAVIRGAGGVRARGARAADWPTVRGSFWIRAGAACGLVPSRCRVLWETGLVMPANAALAALLAALVVFERPADSNEPER